MRKEEALLQTKQKLQICLRGCSTMHGTPVRNPGKSRARGSTPFLYEQPSLSMRDRKILLRTICEIKNQRHSGLKGIMNYQALDTNCYKPFTDVNTTLLTVIINECPAIKRLKVCITFPYESGFRV
jgi:hypothetical protein